jgi:hypothetical protein
MTNTSKSFDKPIPHRSKTGEPMEYYILTDDGKQTKVPRDKCIGRKDGAESSHLLFVDEDGGRVYHLPNTAENEELARWNRQFIWREDKREERWAERLEAPCDESDGDDAAHEPIDESRDADVAGIVETKALLDTLYKALATLTQEDAALIRSIFWEGKTERQLAPELGLKEPKSVNKRKHRILELLRDNAGLRSFYE